jgi:VWFA-related protein
MFQHHCFSWLVLLSCISLARSQTGEIAETANPIFKSQVRLVLVDVVVTDQNSQPVTGLHKEDFEVLERGNLFERGKLQTILSFEEHKDVPFVTNNERSSLPPHFYTNEPPIPRTDSVNVLLLDALNTPLGDQSNVRTQMVNYLKTLEPGPRLAIFTLSSHLRLVQGFTADPRALIAALNAKNSGGGPQSSPALGTSAEANMDQQALAEMKDNHSTVGALGALQEFQAEMMETQTASRTLMTLDALQQLSRYLGGFPGRKNVIWFSGSFPQIDFRSNETQLGANDRGGVNEMQKTVNALASAQVAIYPVAAQGLDTDSLYEASQVSARAVTVPGRSPDIEGQNQRLHEDMVNRYFNNKAMDDLATNTGGKAFYNTNGLKEALGEATHKGSYYYRISYSPADGKTDGRYRHIEVRLRKKHCTLAYRRGYYEENNIQSEQGGPDTPTGHLQPLIARGMPDSTQILYKVRVLPSNGQPVKGAPIVGDNKRLSGATTRLGVDLVIPVDDLDFELTPDGVRHGKVELAFVAYDRAGDPLNWAFRSIRTSLKPELYPAVRKTGVQFHQEIDVPKADVYLRTGIYDLVSNKAGTLEIPLSELDLTESILPGGSSAPPNRVSSRPTANPAAESVPVSEHSKAPSPPSTKEIGDRAVASTNSSVINEPAIPMPGAIPGEGASQVSKMLPAEADFHSYCGTLAGTGDHSTALARICEFGLSMRKKLPDVICDREMKRYWTVFRSTWGGRGTMATDADQRADVVTAKVSYRDGQEHYNDVRIDGKAVDATAPELSGTWSDGEFATILAGLFVPSTKAEFEFDKETTVRSAKALVFRFRVEAQNNRFYFLRVDDKVWLPEYEGRLWIDEQNSQLLRLERETAYMPKYPITRMKTSIDYAEIPLADGSRLVLPIHSDVLICSPPVRGNSDNCSRNIIKFANWHKFKATTTIVTSPTN